MRSSTVCWPAPCATSWKMMMPKSLYGRRRVAGLPYPSSTSEVVRVLAAIGKLLRDAHVLQQFPRRAVVARHLHEVRALAVRGRRLDVRIDAPDRRAILHAHRDDHGVRDRERAGDLERVRAAVARPVPRHERLAVVAPAGTSVNVTVPEVIGHADQHRHDARRLSGASPRSRAGIPGVRKNPFFTLNVNVLDVELEEPDALRVRAPERAERGKARIDARILPLELEVAGGHHIALAAGTDDLSALVRAQIPNVRILRLVVEHYEVAHLESASGVRIDRARHGSRVGVPAQVGVEAGPQIRRQFVHVIQAPSRSRARKR